MYSHQITPPAQAVEPVRPRVERPAWLRTPSLAAFVAALILATSVVLAVTLSGSSRIHTSFHKPPAATQSVPRFTPSPVPHGYVRVPMTHQLIPIH